MKKNRNKDKGLGLSLQALALTAGALALHHPAYAQQGFDKLVARDRSASDTGPVQPPSDIDEQSKAILAKSAQRYKALKFLHVETNVFNLGRFDEKTTADFRGPQNLVVDTDAAKGIKTVAYYDGSQVTTVRDFDNIDEYQVRPLADGTRDSFGNALGPYLSGFFAGSDNVFGHQAVQTVKYTGEATVNGVTVDNVTATVLGRNQPSTIIYSIGKEDSLLYKAVQTGTYADGATSELAEVYTYQKVDVEPPANLFKVVIPEGATKVDRFTQSRGIQVNVGDKPFAISGKDIDSQKLNLDQYKGKVVFLDFWATWCAPCRAELPNVKAAYAKYKDQGFDIVGISFDQTIDKVKPFTTKESIGWRQIYDGYWNGPIATAYNVRFIPSTVLIGRDGKVVAVNARGDDLAPAIEAALAK